MKHIQGYNRDQLTLLPEALDDYITQDNPVRFLDAFVDGLDVERLGFQHAVLKETGRPPYHPADLLKLYLYGYLNRIRSSRQLEREAGRNLELLWLLRRLKPDFKTIADFRKDNRRPIRQVCREFTLLCRQLDLFGGDLVAIDGSKFKAVNSPARNFTERKLKKQIKSLDRKIEEYLDELDQADEEDPGGSPGPSAEELQQKIEAMKERRAKLQQVEQEMNETGESQISLTDPDARSMPVSGGRRTAVAYNVQVSVDAKHRLILDHEVTNSPTDQGLLSSLATRAKELLDTDHFDLLADMGYYDGQEVRDCLQAGITPYIPKPDTSANSKLGLFAKKDFRYDPDQDGYWCPADELLTFRFQREEKGRLRRYYATSACTSCSLKARCTRSKKGRRISRWEYEDVLEAMEARVQAHPEKVKLRKTIAEHPFGTLKHHWDQAYFLTKKLENVGTEMSLSVLAYNLKRAIQILGVPRMIEALA